MNQYNIVTLNTCLLLIFLTSPTLHSSESTTPNPSTKTSQPELPAKLETTSSLPDPSTLPERWSAHTCVGANMDYFAVEPTSNHQGEASKRWPLVLVLHGRSLRGSNLDRAKSYGLPATIHRMKDFPFLMIAPQLKIEEVYWRPKKLSLLLDEIESKWPIDPSRIYVIGVSLGAQGTATLIAHDPDRFAAASIIGAYGSKKQAEQAASVPLWAIHGDADDIVPIKPTYDYVQARREAHGEAGVTEFTVLPGEGHGAFTRKVYYELNVLDWFLTFQKPTLEAHN